MAIDVCLPDPINRAFIEPRGAVRYRAFKGGRGSGKSYSIALMSLIWGYRERLRVLATREFQQSIPESFYAELRAAIEKNPFLSYHYQLQKNRIIGRNGTEFIFKGLRHSIGSIKSMAGIDLCIIEEAEDVPEESFMALFPTIRAKKSEIWCIWNPRTRGSAVDERFVQHTPQDAVIATVNWQDNAWFAETSLPGERLNDLSRLDPQTYAHIWEGEYLENSDRQVLHGKVRVLEFEADEAHWDGPYFGIDFGFAQDPTAGVRCWVDKNTLYVDYEGGQVGLEIDHTAAFLSKALPGLPEHVSRADSARPESISYLKRHGLRRIEATKKWQGSVEDGIAHLRGYEAIVVHPRCRELINESRLYSYKVDRITGDILPKVVDAHNHYVDALRYALDAVIRAKMKPVMNQPVRFNF